MNVDALGASLSDRDAIERLVTAPGACVSAGRTRRGTVDSTP